MEQRRIHVRRATEEDVETLVFFNIAMARETEDKALVPEVVEAGVRALLAEKTRGFYLIAEAEGRTVGSLMITREWSDWRNGDFWWIQSVYVEPEHRRNGVFRTLYRVVRKAALSKAGVCGLRLYVETANANAQATYEAMGMREMRYRLYEETFS